MLSNFRSTALVLSLGFLGAGTVLAQNTYSPPRTSPYLNLLRGGSSPGVNYYGLVRPELEFRSSIGQLRQQTQLNQQAITGLQNVQPGPLTTGHQFGFMTHSIYFQNLGGGQASFMTTPGATARATQGAGGGAGRAAPPRSGRGGR